MLLTLLSSLLWRKWPHLHSIHPIRNLMSICSADDYSARYPTRFFVFFIEK